MSKRSNIRQQFKNELSKETKYGESKDAAKKAAREEAERTGEPYKQVRGIYSTKSYKDYVETCQTFMNYCLKHHSEVRSMRDCERYIPEYINDCKERELSAWTINKYIHALSSAYHKEVEELNVEKCVRARKDIKRCRDAQYNKLRQSEKYDKVVMLAQATGCRHTEMLRLRKEDFRENEDGTMSVYKRGKGGIERWCLVNPALQEFVKEFVLNKETVSVNGEERLFRKSEVPTRLPLHDCRSDYAVALYDFYEKAGFANGKIYHCRGELVGYSYDKGVLAKVSQDLQHSRNNVVIDYLWKGR